MLASNFVLFKFEYNVHESGYDNKHKIYVKINISVDKKVMKVPVILYVINNINLTL